MNSVKGSLISVHIAVLILAGTAQFAKIIPLSSLDITFGRSVVACICLLVMVKLSSEKFRLNSARCYVTGVILGLLMSIHWITYFLSIQLAGVAVGVIALFTFPIMTVFIEPLFDGSKVHTRDVISAITVFIGICIMVPETNLANEATLGILIGILSAFLYAMRNVVHRHLFSQYSGSQAMAFQTLIISLSLVFFISDDLINSGWSNWGLLIVLGSLFTALPHALVASALRHLKAKTFSLITCLQPIYAAIFAILLLSENPGWQAWLGGAMVLIAAVFETINTVKPKKDQPVSDPVD